MRWSQPLVALLLGACAPATASEPATASAPASGPAAGSEAEAAQVPGSRDQETTFTPSWSPSALNGLIVPVPPDEAGDVEVEIDERGFATGQVHHRGRLVAIPRDECSAMLREPPGPLTVPLTHRSLESDREAAVALVTCLNELATKVPLGIHVRETEQTWMPVTGMTMLSIPILEDLRDEHTLRHLVVTEFARLSNVRGLDGLEYLKANRPQDVEALTTLVGLRWLGMSDVQPGHAAFLAQLPMLEHVELTSGLVTQADIEALSSIGALRHLTLNVDSDGPLDLQPLVRADRLSVLELGRVTQVTPASLEVLCGREGLTVRPPRWDAQREGSCR